MSGVAAEPVSAAEAMLTALRGRRSFALVAEPAPDLELIRQVIEAATWAPNHHRTEPWRFVVLQGDERRVFGERLAELRARELPDPAAEEAQSILAKERAKPLRAPVLIAVAAVPTGNPKAKPIEDILAVAAGVENMLLAAQALGLHAMWRTGWPAYSDEVKRYLGLPAGAHIVAFVYLGHPALPHVERLRHDVSRFITWRGGMETHRPATEGPPDPPAAHDR